VHNCTNNILIADAIMLAEALRAVPETLRRAGRYYAVVPAHVDGCFHPKIFLRLGRDRGCLQIASANATAAGWCRNLELSAKLSWTNDGNDREAAAKRSLIRKAYNYLLHWLDTSPGQAIPAKLQIHANDADWLLDTEPNSGPVLLHDGTAVDLLLERGDGSSPGILDRLRACVDRDRINRIVIVSPYWDANGEALLDLQDAFDGAPVVIGLNPRSGTFPGALDVSQRPITFATDKTLQVERFAHAKLFLLEGENADHIVFGSPNASRAALGAPRIPARNAEAAVYRRLPPSSVRHALKLTLDDPVKRLAIPPAPASFLPGRGAPRCIRPRRDREPGDHLVACAELPCHRGVVGPGAGPSFGEARRQRPGVSRTPRQTAIAPCRPLRLGGWPRNLAGHRP
jgi:hypothetical protein